MSALDTRPGAAPRADSRHGRGSRRPPLPTALTLLVLGNAVGSVLIAVAVPWLVLTTTGSAALAGTAAFAGVTNATVGGLAAGRVVDAIGPVRTTPAPRVVGLSAATRLRGSRTRRRRGDTEASGGTLPSSPRRHHTPRHGSVVIARHSGSRQSRTSTG